MSLIAKQKKNWKVYLILIELIFLLFFSNKIVGDNGISGENFILTIVFLSALIHTFFYAILDIYDEDSFKQLNLIAKLLTLVNFIYSSLVFTNILPVENHWILAMISTLLVSGFVLLFFIGLGSLSNIKSNILLKINSFLIIIVTFYGIFLFILQSEKGKFHDVFYYGISIVFLLSLISNITNLKTTNSKKA